MNTRTRIEVYRRQRHGGDLTPRQVRRMQKKDWREVGDYAANRESSEVAAK